eukprot:Nk52_evm34s307 gene=Nk52_evmTU34s307
MKQSIIYLNQNLIRQIAFVLVVVITYIQSASYRLTGQQNVVVRRGPSEIQLSSVSLGASVWHSGKCCGDLGIGLGIAGLVESESSLPLWGAIGKVIDAGSDGNEKEKGNVNGEGAKEGSDRGEEQEEADKSSQEVGNNGGNSEKVEDDKDESIYVLPEIIKQLQSHFYLKPEVFEAQDKGKKEEVDSKEVHGNEEEKSNTNNKENESVSSKDSTAREFDVSGLYKGNWLPEDDSFEVLKNMFQFKKTAGNVIYQLKSEPLVGYSSWVSGRLSLGGNVSSSSEPSSGETEGNGQEGSDDSVERQMLKRKYPRMQFIKGYMRLRDGYYSLDASQSYKIYGLYFPDTMEGYLDAHPVDGFKGLYYNATKLPSRLVDWIFDLQRIKGQLHAGETANEKSVDNESASDRNDQEASVKNVLVGEIKTLLEEDLKQSGIVVSGRENAHLSNDAKGGDGHKHGNVVGTTSSSKREPDNTMNCEMQVYLKFANGHAEKEVDETTAESKSGNNEKKDKSEGGGFSFGGASPKRFMSKKEEAWGKLLYGFVVGNSRRGQEPDESESKGGNGSSVTRKGTKCGEVNLGVFANGLVLEEYYSKIQLYTIMVVMICAVQIRLLLRQISHTSNQNRAARVSLITIGQQAILDSYISLLHLYAAIVFETVFNNLLTVAFLKFVLFSGIEMQYILLIWRAKNPTTGTGGWEHVRTQLTLLYSRVYYVLIMGVCIMFRFRDSMAFVLMVAYSFWVPQIISNAYTETRNTLDRLYVYGMSLSRLALPLYFYGCPKNITIAPNYPFLVCLCTWVAFQTVVLHLQDRWGPRFFIPARFLPEKYNYHRTVHFTHFAERDPETGNEILDCVICMSPINKQLADYMITPCNHIFHPACLHQWIDVKLECPTCRRELPPP